MCKVFSFFMFFYSFSYLYVLLMQLKLNRNWQVDKILEFQPQHQSFQWIFRIDFLQDGLVGFPCSPRLWDNTFLLLKPTDMWHLLRQTQEINTSGSLNQSWPSLANRTLTTDMNIQKIKTTASGSITSWEIDGEVMERDSLFWGALKSLQMVTAAMKLKDACSLKEKLWQT